MLTIAADPKHLGARIGITSVLHSWGSAMTHHPHVHMIVPGGGLARDGSRWVPSKPNFCLPVRVLSKLFRRLMLTKLAAAHAAGSCSSSGPMHISQTPPDTMSVLVPDSDALEDIINRCVEFLT